MRRAAGALAVLLPASVTAAADTAGGNYMGSGRACYGMLTITERSITWMTPFSQCTASPYVVLARAIAAGAVRITYRLSRPNSTCRYRVLVLSHRAGADMEVGWNVTGFPSLDSARLNRRDEALGCYLYRY